MGPAPTDLTPRHLCPAVEESIRDFRAVMLHGPRQSGKTTLAKMVAGEMGGTYWSLDDPQTRSEMLDDPIHHLTQYPTPIVVDEIQHGGDRIVQQIKLIVDENHAPGQFLITGSTNFMTVPGISESLAGRIVICDLWPFSEAEIAEIQGPQIHRWFQEPFGWDGRSPTWDEAPTRDWYMRSVCRGGYPELLHVKNTNRKRWYDSYIATVIKRDIQALSRIRPEAAIHDLLSEMAARTGQEINITKTAQGVGVSGPTLRSYLDWMETVRLVYCLRPWSRHQIARAAKRPKWYVSDTGLAASLLGVGPDSLASPSSPFAGPLLESFVANEAIRQLASANPPHGIKCWHWREFTNQHEVDLVLTRPDGALIAMEVKATSTPSREHARSLIWLRDKVDDASPGLFKAGYLLHTGKRCTQISDRIFLRPIAALWRDTTPRQTCLLPKEQG